MTPAIAYRSWPETGKHSDSLRPRLQKSGRNAAAFAAITDLDSDGRWGSNAAEIKANTNPGDPLSAPDKKLAPHVVVSYDDLVRKHIPTHKQAIFVNVSKSKDGDSYSELRGFKLIDVLDSCRHGKRTNKHRCDQPGRIHYNILHRLSCAGRTRKRRRYSVWTKKL